MDDFTIKRSSLDEIAEDLIDAAHVIHKYHIGIALGQDPPEGFEKGNKEYQHMILETVEPLLKKYEETKNINATSSNEVINLLKTGKVKPQEALQLLSLISMRTKVEEEELKLQLKKEIMESLDDD